MRVADTVAGLGAQSYTDVGNGANFTATGQFIEVQVRLTANADGASPIVYDVTVAPVTPPQQTVCDVNLDGDIDKADLSLISRSRNQTAEPGDPRDADGDGRITPNDVKTCIPQCTRPNCALQ